MDLARQTLLAMLAAVCVSLAGCTDKDDAQFEVESCEYRGDVPPGLDENVKCDRFWLEPAISNKVTLEFLYSDGWRLIQVVETGPQLWHIYLERKLSRDWLLSKDASYEEGLQRRREIIACLASNRGPNADPSKCPDQ